MSKVYAVLGAGMQGTAAAYDLAKFADADRILLGDVSVEQARESAVRVNMLSGSACCEPHCVSALDPHGLAGWLQNVDVLLSCVPYWMHPHVAKIAIETKTNMVDLGGNTEVTMETLKMDALAKGNAVSVVPDCGLAPGLVNSLALYLIEQFDETDSINLYCGVLPQNPKPPFNYKLTFNVEGLVTEYDFQAVTLRDHQIHLVDTLDEIEALEVEGLGTMEAFTTSGGTSTAPYTFQGKVRNYEYKTIRYPGHCERMRIFKDFGFWSNEELDVQGVKVRPRELFYKVFGDALRKFEDKDLCAVRAVGVGKIDGQLVKKQVDILDFQCETTGFTAMERLTGFSMALYAKEIADGNVPAGCIRYEQAVSGARFVEQIQKRGVQLKFS